MTDRDVMEYDVVIVGAGPAGLSTAIRLKQLKPDLTVCVLEKASAVGAHMLSGCVMEPAALDALLPDWRKSPPGICVPAKRDEFRYLTRKSAIRLPNPPQMHNRGNFIVSLGLLVPWMSQQAEALGVDVFPGFSGAGALIEDGRVTGIRLGDMGLGKDGKPGPNYAPGADIRAATTILAEGCRGSITKKVIAQLELDAGCSPQTFGLGFKELWQLPPGRAEAGLIQHSIGWPVDSHTYGGSFVYHLDQDRIYIGYVIGLDYADPRFAPFEAFQQFKHHPRVHRLLDGGELLSYGARTIAAGGWQSLPRMDAPGLMLVGDAAGTLNVPKIKGVHQAIRCGVLAAEHLAEHGKTDGFDARWRASEGGRELKRVRNFKPGFHRGLWFGLANAAFETVIGPDASDRITMAITHACAQAAADAEVEAILCCTVSGRTARAMARFRPMARLIGLSPDMATVRSMSLTWGVTPLHVDTFGSTDELVWFAIESAVQHELVSTGAVVAVLAGAPDRPSGAATDVLRLVRVG